MKSFQYEFLWKLLSLNLAAQCGTYHLWFILSHHIHVCRRTWFILCQLNINHVYCCAMYGYYPIRTLPLGSCTCALNWDGLRPVCVVLECTLLKPERPIYILLIQTYIFAVLTVATYALKFSINVTNTHWSHGHSSKEQNKFLSHKSTK